jgi:hypothetical protein
MFCNKKYKRLESYLDGKADDYRVARLERDATMYMIRIKELEEKQAMLLDYLKLCVRDTPAKTEIVSMCTDQHQKN